MQKIAYTLLIALGVISFSAQADVASAQKLADKYMAFAKNIQPDAKASADAGKAFYNRKITLKGKEVSCSTCHTENPAAVGKTAAGFKGIEAGKPIKALAPSANPARFSNVDKVEDNFTKHCENILGKDCSAQEKADYITYLLTVK